MSTALMKRPGAGGSGLQGRDPRLALTAICLGFLMITLDATIVNVALPAIIKNLGGRLSSAQWIADGYTLAFAALLLSAGVLADRLGARTAYLLGLGVFAVGSALCAAAGSIDLLIAARVLQGVGAAWLMPSSLALIAHSFPEGAARRQALAVWGGASGVGLASGPILAGILTSAIGWRAIFLVNVPVAIGAAVLLIRHVAETRRHRQPIDRAGQGMVIAALALLTGGFIVAGQRGWGAPLTLGLLGAGAVAAVGFVVIERVVGEPMIDPDLLRRPNVSVAALVGLIFNFSLYGAIFCLALDLHDAHGLDAFAAGIALLPMTVVTGATAFLSGRVITRIGEWRAMAAGLSAGLVGAVLVAANPSRGAVWLLVLSTVPLGLTAMAMPAMTAAAMVGVPRHRVGLASGVLNAARQIGGAFGVAVLGALLGSDGAVQLHVSFAVIAAAYAIGLMLVARPCQMYRRR